MIEVILKEHVEHLGERGDVVKVAPGYARNYLLPRKLALAVTSGNKKQIEHEKKAAAARGLTSARSVKFSRSSTRRTASVSACTVAERGARSKRLISPKKLPDVSRPNTCSTRPVTALEMTTEPLRTTNISFP